MRVASRPSDPTSGGGSCRSIRTTTGRGCCVGGSAPRRRLSSRRRCGASPSQTARRLSCDAGIVVSTHRNGKVLDVGRRRRTISPALQRALRARDGCCQFPGCTNHRFIDAHHIKHWARGGDTSLDNLVLLCGHHHRLVHEGGFTLERGRDGAIVVLTPNRRRISAVPRNRRGDCTRVARTNRQRGFEPAAGSLLPTDGGPFDLDLAVDAMLWFTQPPDHASGP